VAEQGLSVVRACSAVGLSRSAWYREPQDKLERDREVIDALQELVEEKPSWGFYLCYKRLRLNGHKWNHKRVYRVYRELGLNIRRKTKKRLPVRDPLPMEVPDRPNAVWSLDFMSDSLYFGKRFRTLNIMDEGVREILHIEIDTSLPGARVVEALERLKSWRGVPEALRSDNGPEFISQALADWCEENGVELRHIEPGKPNQNAYIERFNRTYREEVLNAYLFDSLDRVREITENWMRSYNEWRPHSSLGGLPPTVYREMITADVSSYELSS
jgi:putative transposase